jgi:NADP-dependent 3-hydroxy acid dehydrogenase YdfG
VNLDGAVALITGASSGIGEAAAQALAERGATVVAAARRRSRLASVVSQIEAAGGRAEAVELDVCNESDIERVAAHLRERYGRLDVLVNSAGVMLSAAVAVAKTSDWRRMIDTNLTGLMLMTHGVLPLMLQRKSGHVVNVSSVGARLQNVGSPAYSATKNGVGAFSESLRKECAKSGIRVSVLLPGLVQTELFAHVDDPAVRARFGAMLESMTPLQPRDVAAAIVFVLEQPAHVSVNEIVVRPTEQVE